MIWGRLYLTLRLKILRYRIPINNIHIVPQFLEYQIFIQKICFWYIFYMETRQYWVEINCVKSVHIQSFSGHYSIRMWNNTDLKNSKYGHFSRSDSLSHFTSVIWYHWYIECFSRKIKGEKIGDLITSFNPMSMIKLLRQSPVSGQTVFSQQYHN